MSKAEYQPNIILILGMHRSGTSLVTRFIAKWGASPGTELMPATEYNPDGYWEYQPLVNFHEKMLQENNSTWYAPVNLPPTKELLEKYGDEARSLVREMDSCGQDWCWKDPRMPLFLDFWKTILAGRKVIFVVVYRHPFKIVSSLRKRDVLPVEVSTALWEITSWNILKHLEKFDSFIINYDAILENTERETGALFQFLDKATGKPQVTEITSETYSAVNKSYNHESTGIRFPLNSLQEKIIESYKTEKVAGNVLESQAYLSKSLETIWMFHRYKPADYAAKLNTQKEAGDFTEKFTCHKRVDVEATRLVFRNLHPFAPGQLRMVLLNDYAVIRIGKIQFFYNDELVDLEYEFSSNAISQEESVFSFDNKYPHLIITCKNPENTLADEVIIELEYLKVGAGVLHELKTAIDKRQMDEIRKLKVDFRRQLDYQMASQDQLRKQLTSNHETISELNATVSHLNLELSKIQSSPGYRMLTFAGNMLTPSGWKKILKKLKSRFRQFQDARLISRSGYFDATYYLENNPDVKKLKTSPIKHYLLYGGFEGRAPSPFFSSSFYLKENPDVLAGGINPLIHFLKNGIHENRRPLPSLSKTDPKFADNKTEDIKQVEVNDDGKSPHFSPPLNDYSLQVPFEFEVQKISPQPTIAVICHLFYTDLLGEIQGYLKNIPYPFDLFITTDTAEKKNLIEQFFAGGPAQILKVKVMPNRGRDIAPKLLAWPQVYEQHEFFLHIHSKKTVQFEVLSGWRAYLYDTLLGSENTVKGIFEMFDADRTLGMIAPQHFINMRHAVGWGWNFEEAEPFAKKLGIKINIDDPVDFPSGSMFWGRSSALKPLLQAGLKTEDFPPEGGQTDKTLSHIIERLYFFVCEQAGYSWIKINSSLNHPPGERSISVKSREQLHELMPNVKNSLLQSGKVQPEKNLKKATDEDNSKELKTLLPLHERLKYVRIQACSPFADMEFDDFVDELKKHIAGRESIIDFDEDFYKKVHPDVKRLIAIGVYECGFIHHCLHGKYENRLWSNREVMREFKLPVNLPGGMKTPQNIHLKHHYEPIKNKLKPAEKPFMLILFSHLQPDLFYAGYRAFFKDFETVFPRFDRIVLSVENEPFESELATKYYGSIEVVSRDQLYLLETLPDLIVCFNNHLVIKALKLFKRPERTVYYCQEFEAGFYPYGTDYVFAEKAIAHSENLIISTVMLRDFLKKRGLLLNSRVHVTSPVIEIFDVKPAKNKKLFFYFRPEYFHARNIPELIWEGVHGFCHRHDGYDLYLVGTIDTRFSLEMDGNRIFIINKLPNGEYIKLISSCDVVVSMIYSAHPGVVAFQAAASGIPAVTNVFENRDADYFRQISENIVPYDPITDSLTERIETATGMPKGKKSFRSEFYGGSQKNDLSEFILKIISK